MHEVMFADRVLREARKAGATKFLRVEVGELCEMTREEMEEGLEKLTKTRVVSDIKEAGSVLLQSSGGKGVEEGNLDFKVDFKESKIECSCGFVGRARIVDRGHGYCIFNCPSCGKSGKNVEVLEGGEIKVVEVE
ncbi:MAG: hypothetical protein ABIH92_03605 [Nanoarchaeota archaeon]